MFWTSASDSALWIDKFWEGETWVSCTHFWGVLLGPIRAGGTQSGTNVHSSTKGKISHGHAETKTQERPKSTDRAPSCGRWETAVELLVPSLEPSPLSVLCWGKGLPQYLPPNTAYKWKMKIQTTVCFQITYLSYYREITPFDHHSPYIFPHTAFQGTSLFCLFSESGRCFLCCPCNHCASRYVPPSLRTGDTCGMANNSNPSNLETYNLPDQIKAKRNKGDG